MNKVILIGRVVKDIETKEKLGKFTLAVNRPYKNQNGEYEADFLNCIVFNATDYVKNNLKKGSQISVDGSIQTRTYEIEGNKKYTTEIIVNRIELLNPKKEEPKEEPKENPFKSFGEKVDYEFKQQEMSFDEEGYPFNG